MDKRALLAILKTYRDVPLVKILAGIRRCGKSIILNMLQENLIKDGVNVDYIISMCYTSEDFGNGMMDKDMYNGIKEKMTDSERYYLLLDEGAAYQTVEGIYNSVINSDITKRHNIKNFDFFNRVVKYVVENVGKTFSANAIAKFLKSEERFLCLDVCNGVLDSWIAPVS